MTDEILMAAAQMTPDDLMHHGVKGMKWGVRRTPAELAAASGGPGGGASVEDVDELEEKISENEQKLAEMKADGADEKEVRAMEASIKAGKERVNQILDAERRNGVAFEHAMSFTPDEVFTGLAEDELFLEHHGIKGQKWGVRRFQPYRQGMKVAGGKVIGAAKKVKQRFKDIGDARQQKKAAKAKAKSVKKAQATRKANANFEAEKKKAIESGSIEDLAKFKGKLTNEEYSKAFLRLQNEKKMSDMVAANQKTVWDTIDKGMSIVQKVGGYANTIATAKENFSKLDKAFNGERDKAAEDAKKSIKDAEKNRALTQVTNITELDRVQRKPVRRLMSRRSPMRIRLRALQLTVRTAAKTILRRTPVMTTRILRTLRNLRRHTRRLQALYETKLLTRIRMANLTVLNRLQKLLHLANELSLASSPVQISRCPITLSRL